MVPGARPTNTTNTTNTTITADKERGSHFSLSISFPLHPLHPCHVGRLMLLAQGTSHEHGRGPASARIHTHM